MIPWIPIAIIFSASFLIGVLAIITYNRFSAKQVRIQEANENIDLFLAQRREAIASLQPLLDALSEEVRTHHRQATLDLQALTSDQDARPGRGNKIAQSDHSARALMAQLRPFNDTSVQRVLDRLERTEVELNGARRYHNALVREHNTQIRTFPTAMVALLLRIREKEYIKDTPA